MYIYMLTGADFFNNTHSTRSLVAFGQQHIGGWSNTPISIQISLIWHLPTMHLDVYEFEPKTPELLTNRQWFYNDETRKNEYVDKASPPLAMVRVEQMERGQFEEYIEMVVEKHMEPFARIFYRDQLDDFLESLLQLMVKYKPEKAEEVSLTLPEHYTI